MTKSEPVPLEIVAIAIPLSITDVYFSSYSNPSTVNIVVNNPNNIETEVTVKICIDNYGTSAPVVEITDTIPANSEKILTKNVSELNLSSGEHFIYCSLK